MELLEELSRLRIGTDACDHGIHPDRLNEYIQLITREHPGKSFCVIADWVWNEVLFPEEVLHRLFDKGLHPHFLYSKNIVQDTDQRGFSSVFTSLQKSFSHNSVFESENRIYLLLGPGRRNSVHHEAYLQLSGAWSIEFFLSSLTKSTKNH